MMVVMTYNEGDDREDDHEDEDNDNDGDDVQRRGG